MSESEYDDNNSDGYGDRTSSSTEGGDAMDDSDIEMGRLNTHTNSSSGDGIGNAEKSFKKSYF